LIEETIKLLNYNRVRFAALMKTLEKMKVAPSGEQYLRD
jgi:hypothetical protein